MAEEKPRVRVAAGQSYLTPADANPPDGTGLSAPTVDSFQNFALQLGLGTDNPMSASTYGFNPITRNRVLLEWIHRGSWLGGMAIDIIADDMTREGAEIVSKLSPDQVKEVETELTDQGVCASIADTIRWARLYGGCLGVIQIDGADYAEPLRPDAIGKGSFQGIAVLDRWMVEPTLMNLIKSGPEAGLPAFYRVLSNAPTLRGLTIHHSRCIRLEGVRLPYNQRQAENLWGISVIERLYDRMIAFDSATTGAAQLVHKSYLRTYKIEGLREIIATGGAMLTGLTNFVQHMRRFQTQEGITLLDAKDEFEIKQGGQYTGISDALVQFGQQLSGALEIPLVRLFGQSPAGLNASGESDLRTYNDGIRHRQTRELLVGTTKVYRVAALSRGIRPPGDFQIGFKPLWQMTEKEKGEVAKATADAVSAVYDAGIISQQIALKELQAAGRATGTFTNITDADVAAADPEIPKATAELDDAPPALGGLPTPGGGTPGGNSRPDGSSPPLRAVR